MSIEDAYGIRAGIRRRGCHKTAKRRRQNMAAECKNILNATFAGETAET